MPASPGLRPERAPRWRPSSEAALTTRGRGSVQATSRPAAARTSWPVRQVKRPGYECALLASGHGAMSRLIAGISQHKLEQCAGGTANVPWRTPNRAQGALQIESLDLDQPQLARFNRVTDRQRAEHRRAD